MIPSYSVYRGPGKRLVAISTSPVDGQWIIKRGEQGKKLKVSTAPSGGYATFDDVKAEHLDTGYQLAFTGPIDAYGYSTDAPSNEVIFWEARSVDFESCRALLREYAEQMQSLGVSMSYVDDLSGTKVQIAQTGFGLSRARAPEVIDDQGNGAGTVSFAGSADLIALIGLLAISVDLTIADSEGNRLNSRQILHRCDPHLSEEMATFLAERGYSSLSAAIRRVKGTQVHF